MNDTNTDEPDATLAEALENSEKLPAMNEWLRQPRSEAEQARYAFLSMKKHFERAGLKLRETDVPGNLRSFALQFYLNVDSIFRQPEHSAMLKSFFAEITDFYEAISGEFFAYNLLGLFENFIDRDPPRTRFAALLPAKALAQFDEINGILDRQHEEFIERQNQMGY